MKRGFFRIGVPLLILLVCLVPYPMFVTEPCTLLPLAHLELRARIDGIAASISVIEGAEVKEGDVLVEFDRSELEVALRAAEAEVKRLEAILQKTLRGHRQQEIQRALSALSAASRDAKFAKLEYERSEQLFAQGVGSAAQRDLAKRDYELKRAKRGERRARLALIREGSREEEITAAEAELDRAEVMLADVKEKMERLTVRAPVDGVVMTPHLEEKLHSRFARGDTVVAMADTKRVKVEIYVPEREIDLVELGQPVTVKVESLPFDPFRGSIEFIAPAVEVRERERVVRAAAVLDNDGRLRIGMTGYAEINTGRAPIAWLAVRRAVRWVRVRFLI